MNPGLESLHRQTVHLLAGLTAAQTQLRPHGRPSAWTIQQVAEHLLLTYQSTRKGLSVRLEKSAPTPLTLTLRHRTSQFLINTLGYFPGRRQAPDFVTPPSSPVPMDGCTLSSRFTEELELLNADLDRCHSALGPGPIMKHFSLGPMTRENWCRFHLAHGRHHLRQIRAILRSQSEPFQ